jgi:hypothetical protein
MPLIDLALVLIVIGRWVVADQSFYPHGLEHQHDSERRRSDCRLCLGLAGRGLVGGYNQFSILALTHCVNRADASSRTPAEAR